MPITFIENLLKFGRGQLGKTKRHFLSGLGTNEYEQMNNSTEGILLFKNTGYAICESFLYTKSFV